MWIAQRVTELLGIEDDVLIAYIYEQLEGHKVLVCTVRALRDLIVLVFIQCDGCAPSAEPLQLWRADCGPAAAADQSDWLPGEEHVPLLQGMYAAHACGLVLHMCCVVP